MSLKDLNSKKVLECCLDMKEFFDVRMKEDKPFLPDNQNAELVRHLQELGYSDRVIAMAFVVSIEILTKVYNEYEREQNV